MFQKDYFLWKWVHVIFLEQIGIVLPCVSFQIKIRKAMFIIQCGRGKFK